VDGVSIASIILDHPKRRAGVRAEGRVHWLPPALYEPMARLAQKYDAMDGAMRHWEAILREAEIVARDA
jgi:hypothetical protein